MVSALLACVLGATQGVRHAFEPDHLAAVSTVVAEQKRARATVLFASMWGLGHATVLVTLSGAMFVMRTKMPDRLGEVFELFVAMMLVGLGIRDVWLAIHRGRGIAIIAPPTMAF